MKSSFVVKSVASVAVCVGLAACTDNGSSGGGGGGAAAGGAGGSGAMGGGSTYDTSFAAIQGRVPTSTALSGTASYTGQVEILTGLDQNNLEESVIGDLNLDVNFDANSNPISGSASNFEGTVAGQQTTINGTLTTANSTNNFNVITETNVNIPTQGPATFTSMAVELAGDLSDTTGTLTGRGQMTLQGNFVGPDGEGAFGASALVINPGGGGAGPGLGGGTYYIEKN